jgi:hypothetical protein
MTKAGAGCGLIWKNAGKTREVLALDGVNRMRNAFNQGGCQLIFDVKAYTRAWVGGRALSRMGHGSDVPLSVTVYGEAELKRPLADTRAVGNNLAF